MSKIKADNEKDKGATPSQVQGINRAVEESRRRSWMGF